MSSFVIKGGSPLVGTIRIQGAKNAALPMMAAAVLHRGTTVLLHVPRIRDVEVMREILDALGCQSRWLAAGAASTALEICAEDLHSFEIPAEAGRRMRSSVLLLGPLLGRCGRAVLHEPGGCSIGRRPIDLHLQALRQMGVCLTETEALTAETTALHGAEISLPFPSVGATENIILAAVCAPGQTRLSGAACEPEIAALCQLLVQMGAQIRGIGTAELLIDGVTALRDVRHQVPGDRIAAATYLCAAVACQGEICVQGIEADTLAEPLELLRQNGCQITCGRNEICLQCSRQLRGQMVLETAPYPGFPTDLQSPFLAMLATARQPSAITERIFDGRFKAAEELNRLGAGIRVEAGTAYLPGNRTLTGAEVTAQDLRCGAALVIAGLAAAGQTRIGQSHHILRGYEDMPAQLRRLGAEICG